MEALDGPNNGYLFEGIGSASTNVLDPGTPCAYGGLIYAYNGTSLRIWRPDDVNGAAVCISDTLGFGKNSQASQNGKLIFRAFQVNGMLCFILGTFFPLKYVCQSVLYLSKFIPFVMSQMAKKNHIWQKKSKTINLSDNIET